MKFSFLLIISLFTINLHSQTVDDFELKNIEGKYVSFSDIQGEKLTVIDFWASWCKPCMKAMPKLNSLYTEYKDNGVQIIGINCDGPRSAGKVEPLVNSLSIEYPVLTDMDKSVMNDLNMSVFPTLLIVDPDGKILWIHEGFISGDEDLIQKKIKSYLDDN